MRCVRKELHLVCYSNAFRAFSFAKRSGSGLVPPRKQMLLKLSAIKTRVTASLRRVISRVEVGEEEDAIEEQHHL